MDITRGFCNPRKSTTLEMAPAYCVSIKDLAKAKNHPSPTILLNLDHTRTTTEMTTESDNLSLEIDALFTEIEQGLPRQQSHTSNSASR